MADEPEKEKGPELESESEHERLKELESGSDSEEKCWTGRGRIHKGDWYCDCEGDVRAKCRPAGRQAKPANRGRKFWSCPKPERDRCEFFLWVDDEPKARAWLEQRGLFRPATPPLQKKDVTVNPFSLSKRKSSAKSVAFSNRPDIEITHAGPVNEDDLEYEDPDSPSRTASRKSAKANHSSRPGQSLNDKLQAAAAQTLPSPQSNRKPNGEPFPPPPTASTNGTAPPAPATNLPDSKHHPAPPSLATTVIKLLRSEGVDLKESTELQVRHEIELVTDRHEAEARRYQKTIAYLSKRLGELESTVVYLGGDVAMDDEVEFSD